MCPIARRVRSVGFALALALVAGCSTDPERAKQEYLASGDRYVEQKKYHEAIVQYRNALQQDARFGDARLKLARAYEQIGDTPNARREYVRAADALPGSVEAQVKAGSSLLLSRQFEDARTRAENALKLDPRNLDAQLLLGNALASLKDLDGALKELEEAVKLDPTSAAAHTGVGAVQLAQGRAGAAEAAFRKAVETNPKLPVAHLALANFLWAVGRPTDAEHALKQALAIEPGNTVAHRALATMYMATRRASQAEPHLKALADQDHASTAPLKLALADYYVLINRPDDAMRVLEGVSQLKDAASPAQTRVAAIEYVNSGKAEGNRVIDAVLARDPKNVPALLVKTRFQMKEGKLDAALVSAKAAAAADAQSIQARYLMGTILRARRRPEEAIAAFNEVLKINPRAAAAQVQLAELNMQEGQANTALQLATDAAKQLPNDPRVRLTLVHTLVANNQLEQAQQTVAGLLKALPDVAPVQAAAGTVALARKDVAGARRAFARAIELDPANFEALSGLIRLDFAEKKPDAARARVERQLAATPASPAVLTLAARVYASSGDPKRTEELLRKVIEVDASNMQAFSMLGQLYASQNRLADARASFESILKERPDATGINTIVAILYETEGNRTEARKRYERVMQLDPSAAVAANNLAYIYAEDGGNLDLALELAQTARRKLPDSAEVADTLGWVYVKKDLPTLAIPRLEEAVSKSPGTALLQYHLGVALIKAGQKIKGRQVIERALNLKLPPPLADEARQLVSEL